MKFVQHFWAPLAALFAVLAFGVCAAQTDGSASDTKPTTSKSVEERIKALENRFADFEKKFLDQAGKDAGIARDDMEDMFNRMRREFGEKGEAFNWKDFFGHFDHRGTMKPRLGVELASVTDDLKTRFNTDVKMGAFVMSVTPGTPAEKAGIMMGDALTAFDGKSIGGPLDMIEAVKTATAGSHDIMGQRHSEMKTFKVEFADANAVAGNHGKWSNPTRWLWSGKGPHENVNSKTEVHVSALELSDALAKDLKLSDTQKSKAKYILGTQEEQLKDAFVAQTESKLSNGDLNFSMNADLSALAEKNVNNAAKDLSGVLDATQLKLWNEYRAAHSSVSFSQSITIDNMHDGNGKS